MKKQYKQKRNKLNLRVKRDLQVWVLIRILFIVIVSIAIALLILYFFSHKQIGSTFRMAHLTIQHVSDLLLPVILASGGLCILVGLFFAIFLPQKIAGPVYRIERGLLEVANGDFKHVFRLRRSDRLQTLADAANQALHRVNHEFKGLYDGLGEIEIALGRGDRQQVLNKIIELRKHLGDIR